MAGGLKFVKSCGAAHRKEAGSNKGRKPKIQGRVSKKTGKSSKEFDKREFVSKHLLTCRGICSKGKILLVIRGIFLCSKLPVYQNLKKVKKVIQFDAMSII